MRAIVRTAPPIFADAKSTYCGARKSTGSRFAMAACMQRPSSVKLASVKHELYHPLLPTLRKMDMDEVARRLPDEHSRTTTQCTRDMFASARSTLHFPKKRLHCKETLSRQTDTAIQSYQPLNVPNYTESWNATLELLKSLSTSPSTETDSPKITGLSLRSKLPAITNAWQYCITGDHLSRPSTARPLPAYMYSRHRAVRRPPTAVPWK